MTRTAADAGLMQGRLRTLTLGSVALVSLAAFEAIAVATAMPTVAAALDGLAAYALAFGLPLATSVVGMVLAGVWSDLRGPGGAMRVGVAGFVLGLLLAGLAPAMPLLAMGRAVQGLGSGLFSVALYVVVARVVPAALRPRIFAAFAAAWVLPAVVGPPLAGLLVETVGWRSVFLLAAVLALPAALLVEPALRGLGTAIDDGTSTGHRRTRRVLWAVGAAAGAAGLHQAGQLGGVPALLLGVVAVAAVVVSGPHLLPAGTLLARPGLPAVIAVRGVLSAAFFAAEAFLPLLLSRERDLSPTMSGLVLTVAAVTWSAGSWFQGRDRAPSRTALLRAGTALVALGVLAAGATVVPGVPVAVAGIGWAAGGLGMGMAYPTLSVLTLELSAPSEQGTNSSALQIADALFAAVVLALTGALFAALVDAGTVAYLAGTAVAGGLALVAVLIAGRARAATE
ncbi:MFS transporter [Pseudonocardia alaniniphila]|uniref:MFS transporter n=1 Tax=Pseudonocardia alaniniphila TaxID=75291 RepID=A0ABS9TV39_9PSEU|nr:MFS transporter [Pseudonocardia alaniniphila]MCH6172419.1 MFS transporter [Pseudonocardia alaniniphila]